MRPLSILLLSVLSLVACNRDDAPQPTPPPAAPTFGISGDTVAAVMRARSAEATILLSDSGARQAVSLSISGLPPGVTAEIEPPSGTPPFSATLRLRASVYAVAGSSFTATVLARMDDSTSKIHSIKVTVLENPDCVEIVSGEYRGWGTQLGGGWPATITADTSMPQTRIRFKKFFAGFYDAYADLNCTNSTMVFPSQSIGSAGTMTGTGTFTRDSVKADVTHTYTVPPVGSGPPTQQTHHRSIVFARQ